ncbi:MAG: Vps62-related protein [Persicimonas sp.]
MFHLRSILHAFEQLFTTLVSQGFAGVRPVASGLNDIFYGVFMSAVVVGLVAPTAQTAGFEPPPSERPSIEETIERFAPEVRFHPRERYFPSSVSWFIERSELRVDGEQAPGAPTLAEGQTSASILPTLAMEKQKSKRFDPKRYFLEIAGDADEERVRQGNLDSAQTYVHFRETSDGSAGYDIQYWFFYPYSGPLMGGPAGGAHEGDWEHITVRVDSSRQNIQKIFYACHVSEGRWLDPKQVRFDQGDHPVVYSARYGHASYPRAGVHSRGFLPADRTADGGARWKTWNSVELVAVDGEALPEKKWMRFAGRWGQVGTLFSGPRGPAFQAYWHGPQ